MSEGSYIGDGDDYATFKGDETLYQWSARKRQDPKYREEEKLNNAARMRRKRAGMSEKKKQQERDKNAARMRKLRSGS